MLLLRKYWNWLGYSLGWVIGRYFRVDRRRKACWWCSVQSLLQNEEQMLRDKLLFCVFFLSSNILTKTIGHIQQSGFFINVPHEYAQAKKNQIKQITLLCIRIQSCPKTPELLIMVHQVTFFLDIKNDHVQTVTLNSISNLENGCMLGWKHISNGCRSLTITCV